MDDPQLTTGKNTMIRRKPKTVSEYIAAAPRAHQPKLRQLRAAIRSAAPEARESISYSMPYYAYKGRVAYFMLATHHIGLYVMPPIVQQHAYLLKGYKTSKGTVQLPLGKKLPVALVKKLIKARVAWNELKSGSIE